MKYLVVLAQDVIGCDYTIDCGKTFYWVDADSVGEVLENVVWPDGREEYSQLEGEDRLSQILIVPADNVNIIDVGKIRGEILEFRQREKQDRKQAAELAELRRLQAKYGKI